MYLLYLVTQNGEMYQRLVVSNIFDLENISFELLVTFLSNPHFVDGADERDYKLRLLQEDNAALSYLLDVYKTNLADSQTYYSDYSERNSGFIESIDNESIDIDDEPIDLATLQNTMNSFYQQSLIDEVNKAYSQNTEVTNQNIKLVLIGMLTIVIFII